MKVPSNIITLLAGIILTLISLWYGQNHGLMPAAASETAQEVDGLFNLMMTISTGLFLLIEGVLIYSVIRFRRQKGDTTDGPPVEGNVPLEIVWTAIPTVIVFILAIYSFEVYNEMGGLDPMASMDHGGSQMAHEHHDHGQLVALNSDNKSIALGLGASPNSDPNVEPLVIEVQGLQYAWIFTYPESGVISGEMHVPIDRPVQLKMTASDVIHAFWLPELRLKQDVIPGREVQLTFTSNRLGNYPIICAELCGAFHGGMKTTMTVDSPEDFEQWIQDNTFALTDTPGAVAMSSEQSAINN
ncbi:MAG: cytochrome c oxidase subunit II [Xenococcus sp. MO_188.B8]|nr:cytochrome c oxidase subunit II [Xenococcus sp. MO_188.B8]